MIANQQEVSSSGLSHDCPVKIFGRRDKRILINGIFAICLARDTGPNSLSLLSRKPRRTGLSVEKNCRFRGYPGSLPVAIVHGYSLEKPKKIRAKIAIEPQQRALKIQDSRESSVPQTLSSAQRGFRESRSFGARWNSNRTAVGLARVTMVQTVRALKLEMTSPQHAPRLTTEPTDEWVLATSARMTPLLYWPPHMGQY